MALDRGWPVKPVCRLARKKDLTFSQYQRAQRAQLAKPANLKPFKKLQKYNEWR
jgi:hypothetical protein